METIKVALDWSPNTIHSGLLLALHRGRYREAGLDVELLSPEADNYTRTPARRLSEREVDFAIAPSESVIAYQTSRNPAPLTAVASILQRDTSAIVTLGSNRLIRPADLDGKVYASYDARFEDGFVRNMVRDDGGKGDFTAVKIGRFDIWEMLQRGKADATWVFMPWEGVKAERAGIDLNVFKMDDFGIPYGYTPLMLAHQDAIETRSQAYRTFMQVTTEGYQEAVAKLGETAAFLCQSVEHPDFKNRDFIEASLRALAPAQLTPDGQWGRMETKVWQCFTDWLAEKDLLPASPAVDPEKLFTNSIRPGNDRIADHWIVV
jgi:NitT/TauT family transport system substrate-binding protein